MSQDQVLIDAGDFSSTHFLDEDGRPEGGLTSGVGFLISWQRGPLGRGVDRVSPNGAFVENVIRAAVDRLKFYQGSRCACDENRVAIDHLQAALLALNSRTRRREVQGTEGTHEGS